MLFFMQLSKKVPLDNPMVLNGVRAAYVLSNFIILVIYLYVRGKINAKKDRTTLKYVEPAQPGAGEEKLITTTVYAYDLLQLKALFKAQLMGVGMMAVMHFYFKFSSPLMVQSVIPLKSAFEGNLVRIHLLGEPAAGDLERPWKASSGLLGMLMSGGEIKKDKKSIETAEKSGKGGAKEE
ncbi:hypothetical protein FGG08_007257 [Glutinoglossum americanum]|uniref:Inorganic phosphate transport PHO88 n=1 Tax=Glutinoglossum americanum TaxID=1670608 RepID=A0A9P8KU55_9PEZI|nr:hypothetical protein FGG08_007257 [Glutinoglossum americanum]